MTDGQKGGGMKDKTHSAITISRQMGSGGTYIGYLLAKELGYKYIDRGDPASGSQTP